VTPEDKDQITDSIMEAFDSMAEDGAEEGNISEGNLDAEPESEAGDDERGDEADNEEEQDEPEHEQEVEEVEVSAEGDGDDEADGPREPEGEEEEGEGEDEAQAAEYAPDVQAFLDRHEGDLGKALQSAAEQYRMIGERNRQHGEMTRRLAQVEAELAQAQAFQAQSGMLSPEQAEWVGQAIESEQPDAFIQSAVQAGEFDLARAVCDAWGENGDAYQALRTRQAVDQAEYHAYQAQQAAQPPPLIARDDLLGMIAEQVPDFPSYEPEMVEIISQLGDSHPMVVAAKSQDPNEAAMGLIDIYKVAQTRKTRVSEARKGVETQQREQGLAARKQARVSSASSRTSHEEPPRNTKIGPGLTLEELDAAFAAE